MKDEEVGLCTSNEVREERGRVEKEAGKELVLWKELGKDAEDAVWNPPNVILSSKSPEFL